MRSENRWIRGPGGWKCPCCGPAPKHRPAARRYERRQARATVRAALHAEQQVYPGGVRLNLRALRAFLDARDPPFRAV